MGKKFERCKFAHLHLDGKHYSTRNGFDEGDAFPVEVNTCEKCQDYRSRFMEFPLEINGIHSDKITYDNGIYAKIGQLVSVRPCGDEYGGKTYVGFYLGELPVTITHYLNHETKMLMSGVISNPAMYVPEIGKVIFGMSSWWHTINSEYEFSNITDGDIANTWYVKLAKLLSTNKDERHGE